MSIKPVKQPRWCDGCLTDSRKTRIGKTTFIQQSYTSLSEFADLTLLLTGNSRCLPQWMHLHRDSLIHFSANQYGFVVTYLNLFSAHAKQMLNTLKQAPHL